MRGNDADLQEVQQMRAEAFDRAELPVHGQDKEQRV